MPRTHHWRPDRSWPVGFALPLTQIRARDADPNDPNGKIRKEDKPTVLVDPYAKGMAAGLIEAVCQALELWEPVFDHWEDPQPPQHPPKDDADQPYDTRRVPVFRGRHAHRVRKFRDDITHYIHAHRVEPSDQVMLKIASKFVHIRVTPLKGMPDQFGHVDQTHYHREVIRSYVRRSDPEWDVDVILAAREEISAGLIGDAHESVGLILDRYDKAHKTVHLVNYEAEVAALVEDNAPDWEHLRLMSYYVQELTDSALPDPRPVDPHVEPRRRTARRKVTTP